MRNIEYIAVHCTATPLNTKVDNILKYWKETLKWNVPGYHYIIEADGKINNLYTEDRPTNGVAGWNSKIVNVCYIGGVDSKNKAVDNRTDSQKESLIKLLKQLKVKYPKAIIQGHRDFPNVKKDCPSFDAKEEYKDL